MKRMLMLALAGVLALPVVSWGGWGDVLDNAERVDKLITNRPVPPPVPRPPEPSDEAPSSWNDPPRSAPHSGEDTHFIQPDDYFISDKPLGNRSYIYVSLAKMVAAPSPNTKDEGEFMKVRNGENQWTNVIWQSRPATRNELKLGMHLIMFHDNHSKGVYQGPRKKDQARNGAWWYAKITDMTDMYKGYVTVSGGYKVGLDNLRVPLPYGTFDQGGGGKKR